MHLNNFKTHLSRMRSLQSEEKGQNLVLITVFLVALLGMSALTLDIGLLMAERRKVRNAVDAAALASAHDLKFGSTAAQTTALNYIQMNDNGIDPAMVQVTFRCIVGDYDNDGQPDAGEIPRVCDPGIGATFTCVSGRCFSACDPSLGHTCNTTVIETSKEVPFYFAPIFGIVSESTGVIRAAACRGTCGNPLTQLDLVVVLDRTGSLGASGLAEVKNAAKELLKTLNQTAQHVALGVIPSSDVSDVCQPTPDGTIGLWVPVPLSNDYRNADGTLNTNSTLVQTIDCLVMHDTGYPGTNLGDPVLAAKQYLEANGRPGAQKAIILFTDGRANMPENVNPCEYAAQQAQQAKDAGIELSTIGYGVDGRTCNQDASGSPYYNQLVTELLADMATDSLDEWGNCATSQAIADENADGDHFFCEAISASLTPLFKQAAESLVNDVWLVRLP